MCKKQVSQNPSPWQRNESATGIIHCPQCGAPMAVSNVPRILLKTGQETYSLPLFM